MLSTVGDRQVPGSSAASPPGACLNEPTERVTVDVAPIQRYMRTLIEEAGGVERSELMGLLDEGRPLSQTLDNARLAR